MKSIQYSIYFDMASMVNVMMMMLMMINRGSRQLMVVMALAILVVCCVTMMIYLKHKEDVNIQGLPLKHYPGRIIYFFLLLGLNFVFVRVYYPHFSLSVIGFITFGLALYAIWMEVRYLQNRHAPYDADSDTRP